MPADGAPQCPTGLAEGGVNAWVWCFFFIFLDAGPRRPLSLDLSDIEDCAPYIRARLG